MESWKASFLRAGVYPEAEKSTTPVRKEREREGGRGGGGRGGGRERGREGGREGGRERVMAKIECLNNLRYAHVHVHLLHVFLGS